MNAAENAGLTFPENCSYIALSESDKTAAMADDKAPRWIIQAPEEGTETLAGNMTADTIDQAVEIVRAFLKTGLSHVTVATEDRRRRDNRRRHGLEP